MVLGASQIESPSASYPHGAAIPRVFVGGLGRDRIERLVEQSHLALGPALHFESRFPGIVGTVVDAPLRMRELQIGTLERLRDSAPLGRQSLYFQLARGLNAIGIHIFSFLLRVHDAVRSCNE